MVRPEQSRDPPVGPEGEPVQQAREPGHRGGSARHAQARVFFEEEVVEPSSRQVGELEEGVESSSRQVVECEESLFLEEGFLLEEGKREESVVEEGRCKESLVDSSTRLLEDSLDVSSQAEREEVDSRA